MLNTWRQIVAAGTIVTAVANCNADSIETQNNAVVNGTIQVSAGDADRSDWEGIPWFETDDDLDEFYPVDIDRLQIAHDSQNVYFRLQTLTWDVDEDWRVGIYLDTDSDPTSGYNGNFLAVGADYFIESAASYQFMGETPGSWGWNQTADLARDQTSGLDVEISVPRTAIGNPGSFDFLLFANNFCCDFQLPDDIYPNTAGTLFGDFFSYQLGAVPAPPGDFDGSGKLDLTDVNLLNGQIAMGSGDPAFDLNGDALVNRSDLAIWVRDLRKTWFGDANLDGEFNSSDLVSIFQAGRFEQAQDADWDQGDWTGDRRFDSGDLVQAFQDGGFEKGPRAAVSAVPEPSEGGFVWLAACYGLTKRCVSHRRRGRRAYG